MANLENEGFDYWLQWQVPVCALIIIIPAIVAVILIYKSKRAHLSVYDLWVPCWKELNPLWLLIYRALVFVIMFCLLSLDVALHGAYSFYFYTQWTFALVTIYFALGTILSAHGCWTHLKKSATKNEEGDGFLKRGLDESESTTISFRSNKVWGLTKLQIHHERKEIDQRAGFWGNLMQIIYQTCTGAAMQTDIVFWCLLVPFLSADTFRLNLLMGFMHSLNVVFLLLDTALNNLPFPWFGFVYFIIWSCLYIVFQWVLHACGFTWWPYAFLELSTPWAPLWYFALALVHVPCYSFYVLVVKAKNYAFPKLFPHAYVGSSL
ncbi:hypothetical protein BVC80_1543g123 [Macleaya cordata]|uniref:Transmembrane protein n=1 Tax=Macleaya cordata TaxID=56857 RepID=A0A200R1W5_MACCD|nr:hypothetical protein BVC80_1543g123 [Macleaya cordata]